MRTRVRAVCLRLGLACAGVLWGAAAAHAQWATLANSAPGHLDTCLLLTDGGAMCHEYNTNRWHKLTPDVNGSYVNGTWSSLASMPDGTDTTAACTSSCTYAPLF